MRLYKRHLTWWIRYELHGKTVRRSLKTHDRTVAEGTLHAMRLARCGAVGRDVVNAMLDEIWGRERTDAPRPGIPISGAWAAYIDAASAAGLDRVSSDTMRKRRAHFAQFAAWVASERAAVQTVEAVTGPIAAAFAARLKDDGLKDKTRRNTLGDLSTVWTVLSKVSDGVRNPWTGLMPRVMDAETRLPFTREEEDRILAAAAEAGHGWLLACLVARHTGMRYGDVATLRRDEVHLADGVIRYQPNKLKHLTRPVWVTVPIEPLVLAPALAEALAAPVRDELDESLLREHAYYYGLSGHSKMPVQFADILQAAGVESVNHTFHSWRHTLNTRMGEAGIDIETRKRISGHLTDEMSRHYDHSEHLPEMRSAIEAASR